MGKFEFFVIALWTLVVISTADSSEEETPNKNGYMFTCPRNFKLGGTNYFYLRRYGKLDPGTLKVAVLYTESYSGNESLAKEQEYEIGEGVGESELKLHLDTIDTYVYNGRIAINGSFGDGSYKIAGSDKIYFQTVKDTIVIIQTDKPLYKEGQTVKFRIVSVDKNFKPSGSDEVDIWVEDPKGVRMSQWNKVPLGSGMKQMEFLLADEPVHGAWKISASLNGDVKSTTFEVKEYVLPKYEVEIKFPSYVLANAEEIPITICAKYTYGKLVKGTLNMNISLETYTWSTEKVPTLEISEKLDGCFDYLLNVSSVETENYYRYRRIQIKASVEEDGTGVQRNETKYIQRQFSPLNLNFNRDQKQYYKPGLPYNGELKVTNPDDTPAEGEVISICATVSRERILSDWWAKRKVQICKNYTSNEDGIIKFTLPPQNTDSTGVNIEAKSMKYVRDNKESNRQNSLTQPQTSTTLTPFYSPSGSFIQLQPEQDVLHCESKQSVKLLFTSKNNADFKFFYEVINQGSVVKSGTVETSFSVEDDVSKEFQDEEKLLNDREILILPPMLSIDKPSSEEECPSAVEARYVPPVGSVTIDLDVDSSLSPNFYLLVYYIRDDRETVADSQKFKVEKCFKNKVEFEFGDEVKQPGTKTSIRVKGSPNSLCGVKVIDKSISLLDSSDQLTKDRVFSLLENMDSGYCYSVNHCSEEVRQPGLYASSIEDSIIPRPQWSSSSYEDSIAAIESTCSLVMSDLILVTRPCKNNRGNIVYDSYQHQEYAASFGGAGSGVAQASTARRPPPASPAALDSKIGMEDPTKSVVDVRSYFPETWLFDLVMLDTEGELVRKEKLPHTITEWVGSAVCLNADDGLGISPTTSIKGFQAFFLSFTLPYSVIRNEKFRVTVSIYNYVQDSLPVTVSLDKPEGYTVAGDPIDGDICIPPGDSTNLQLYLKATSLGTLNITVRAETAESSGVCGSATVASAIAKDAVTNSLLVNAEGWPVEKVDSILFCPKDEENGIFEKNLVLSLPEDVVPDSARGYLDVTGNVMGPAMDNLENLVAMPTGCGEQNMVKFTPNIVVLNYLTYVGKLTDKLKSRAIRNLNTGAQRQMKYKHPDGSFSAFGTRDRNGSMFLTAFVLRSFAEATNYILIDNQTMSDMQKWITSKQQDDGCFPDIGKIISSGLQGGIEKEKSQVSITAYVLTSLLLSGYQNDTVINSAFSCLRENNENLSLYATALFAYTAAVVGNNKEAQKYISDLKARANATDGVEYYNNVNGSKSLNLETAAYAVLAILKSGGSASEALPVVRYMTQNMNPRGGFISTQDTCVGLEALGEFAKPMFADSVDITVTVLGGLEKTIHITEEERMVMKRNKISEVPSEVTLKAEGSGCALIQNVLRYNTNKPPEEKNFNFAVDGKCEDDGCKHGKIAVSVSYAPVGRKSGMAVIEISMITGKVPIKDTLEKVLEDDSTDIMRYEVNGNVVAFYLNEISNNKTFFNFDVEEIVKVEDSQPATAKVYDYYANENSSSDSYQLLN